jgi:hypothetical protein
MAVSSVPSWVHSSGASSSVNTPEWILSNTPGALDQYLRPIFGQDNASANQGIQTIGQRVGAAVAGAARDPNIRSSLVQLLIADGDLKTSSNGRYTNAELRSATTQLLENAANAGMSVEDYLNSSQTTVQGQGGAGYFPYHQAPIKLVSPYMLADSIAKTAQQTLGHNVTPGETSGFVNWYHNLDLQAAQGQQNAAALIDSFKSQNVTGNQVTTGAQPLSASQIEYTGAPGASSGLLDNAADFYLRTTRPIDYQQHIFTNDPTPIVERVAGASTGANILGGQRTQSVAKPG